MLYGLHVKKSQEVLQHSISLHLSPLSAQRQMACLSLTALQTSTHAWLRLDAVFINLCSTHLHCRLWLEAFVWSVMISCYVPWPMC